MSKVINIVLIVLLVGGGIFALGWFIATRPNLPPITIQSHIEQSKKPLTSSVIEISIVSGNLFFNPNNLTLVKDQPVKITISNAGFHTFTIDELSLDVPLREKSAIVEFTPTQSGIFEYYCAVPGHREGGMFGSLKVE